MRTSVVIRAVAFALASSLVAACGGGGAGVVPSKTSGSPGSGTPTAPFSPTSFTWGQSTVQAAHLVGPATFSSMTVDVLLQPQNAQGLIQYAREASAPGSGLYRHWLTPQQIGQQYGASQSTVAAVGTYFAKYKLGVGTWPQHMLMVVTGSQTNLESAFGTKFGLYQNSVGGRFIAPESTPRFAQTVPIAAISGLVHVRSQHGFFLRPGNGAFLGEHAPQIARAFDFTGAYNSGFNGAGINVGIIGTGPIWQGDYAAYAAANNVKMAPVVQMPVVAQTPSAQNNGTGTGDYDDPTGLASPPPVTGPCSGVAAFPSTGCNQEDGEAQLDTEQAASLAPGASVLFYLGYNNKDCTEFAGFCPNGALGAEGIYVSDDEIQQAIADNTADDISMSYGGGEAQDVNYYYNSSGVGIGPLEFAALTSEGIAAFASSGDNGAYECSTRNGSGVPISTSQLCPAYPSSDPNVVAVGGVNYPMDNAGNLVLGQQITAWANNTTGGGDGTFDNSPGSGGGPSTVFTAPAWQSALSSVVGITGGMRGDPDISMLADPLTGPYLLEYGDFPASSSGAVGPFFGASGGTSAASPEMAAAWGVVLSACKATPSCASGGSGPHPYRLGNPAPLLYSIYGKNLTYAAPAVFYDIVAGSNSVNAGGSTYTGFSAGPGYDLVTGIGVPFVGHMIDGVLGTTSVP